MVFSATAFIRSMMAVQVYVLDGPFTLQMVLSTLTHAIIGVIQSAKKGIKERR